MFESEKAIKYYVAAIVPCRPDVVGLTVLRGFVLLLRVVHRQADRAFRLLARHFEEVRASVVVHQRYQHCAYSTAAHGCGCGCGCGVGVQYQRWYILVSLPKKE